MVSTGGWPGTQRVLWLVLPHWGWRVASLLLSGRAPPLPLPSMGGEAPARPCAYAWGCREAVCPRQVPSAAAANSCPRTGADSVTHWCRGLFLVSLAFRLPAGGGQAPGFPPPRAAGFSLEPRIGGRGGGEPEVAPARGTGASARAVPFFPTPCSDCPFSNTSSSPCTPSQDTVARTAPVRICIFFLHPQASLGTAQLSGHWFRMVTIGTPQGRHAQPP